MKAQTKQLSKEAITNGKGNADNSYNTHKKEENDLQRRHYALQRMRRHWTPEKANSQK